VLMGLATLHIIYNYIYDIGISRGSGNVYAINYRVNNPNTNNINFSDNYITNVLNNTTAATGHSAAIWVGQSTANGIVSNLTIERNVISNVFSGQSNRAATGISLEAAWGAGTGGLNSPLIKDNTISNINGGIAYGIQLTGKTPGAFVTNNLIDDITGLPANPQQAVGVTVPASNTGFETVMIHNNSITNAAYAIYNGNTGPLQATSNWFGSDEYTDIYHVISGPVKFVQYLLNDELDPLQPLYAEGGGPSQLDNLILTHSVSSQNVFVQFDIEDGDMELYPVPGLDPAHPDYLAQVEGRYLALAAAIESNDPVAIQTAALAVGDDVIAEYYYMDGANRVYLQTINNNQLIKNKYWNNYLVRDDDVRYPNWPTPGNPDPAMRTLVLQDHTYRTHTNPGTGAVAFDWLDPVRGKDLYVTVTVIQNGDIYSQTDSVFIPVGVVQVYDGDPDVVSTNLVSSHMTIQGAIDASTTIDGYYITVDAGTYVESNILVNVNNLTIKGIGATREDVVIVPAAEDGNVDNPFGNNAQNGFVIAANKVTIQNLTLDGQGNSSLTPDKNNFRIGIVTLDASQSGGGIWDSLHVDNVYIKNPYRRGISVFPNAISGTIIENTKVENVTFNHGMYVSGQCEVLNNTIIHAFQGIVTAHDATTPAGLIKINGNNLSDIGNSIGCWGYDSGSGTWAGQPRGIQFNNSYSAGREVEIKNNVITDNGFEQFSGAVGIYTRLANENSVVEGNEITLTSGVSWADPGSQAVGMLLGWSYDNGFLAKNNTVNSTKYGIGVMVFGNGTVSKPMILEGNTITSTNSLKLEEGDGTGIYIANQYLFASDKNPSYVIIRNDNTISGFVKGIDIVKIPTSTHELTVEIIDNSASISGNEIGIDANDGILTISGNKIIDNETGIRLTGTAIAEINLNGIFNNDVNLDNQAGAIIDATCNWWGSTDPAIIEASVSGSVVMAPWLVDGTDGDLSTAGFQPATPCVTCDLTASAFVVNASCSNISDGEVSVTPADGTAPYSYLWSNSSTTDAVFDLAVGSYTVTVTDLAGCTATASATVGVEPHVAGTDWFVNDLNQTSDVFTTNIGNDANPGTSVCPFATVNHAITMAAPGDVIKVDAGLYDERIDVNQSLVLKGATAGINKFGYAIPSNYNYDINTESVLRPSDGLTGIVINITAPNVTIDGFIIANENATTSGFRDLIALSNQIIDYTDVQIINNIIGPNQNTASPAANKGRGGIVVYGPSASKVNLAIKNNKIVDANGDGCGIMLLGPSVPDDYTGSLPGMGSTVAGTGNGWTGKYSGSIIEGNEIVGNHRTGIELAGGCDGGTDLADYFRIINNKITLHGLDPNDVPNTNLKWGNGIMLIRTGTAKVDNEGRGASNVLISGNEITANEKNGIYIGPKSRNLEIVNNIIHNNGNAGTPYASWDGIRIDLNESYHTGALTVLDYMEGININNNQITNNGNYSIQVIGIPTLESINGSCNWYGTTDANDVAAMITGLVDYTPYLINGTDASPDPGFQPSVACVACDLTATAVATDASCSNIYDGTATVTPADGTAPYTYLWSNAATTPFVDLLPVGTYTVTVTDLAGCTATASATVGVVPHMAGTDWFVNDNDLTGDIFTTNIGNDANPGTSVCPFATVNYAITMAAPGDVIKVDAGLYEESLTSWKDMEITKSLSLIGAGSGQTVFGLREFVSPNTALNGVEIRGSNLDVHLEGLTFTKRSGASNGPQRALRIGETTSSFNTLTMIDVEVTHAALHNVALDGNANISVFNMSNCSFTDAGSNGFYSFATIQSGTWTDNIFDLNGTNDDWGGGLHLAGPTSNLAVSGGSMSNNSHVGFAGRRLTDVSFENIVASENNGPVGTPGPKGEQGYGMAINEKTDKSENVTFSNITSSNNGFDGYFLTAEVGKTIENVSIVGGTISNNGRTGIYYWPQGGLVSKITIDSVDISGKQPVNLVGQSANPITEIKVLNTTATDIPNGGNTIVVNYANDVEYIGNHVSGSDFNALVVLNSSDVMIQNNETYDNAYAGIILVDVTSAEIINNNVYNNSSGVAYEFGGITIFGSCSNVTIENNLLTDNNIGVKVFSASTGISANHNSITGGTYGVKNDASFTMAATCNWWGTEDSYEVADLITGNVQFLPYLVVDSVNGDTYWWDDQDDYSCDGVGPVRNISKNTSYMTILAATNDADENNEIEVDAGEYNETVTINKSLKLTGAGCGQTIWKGNNITDKSLVILRDNLTPANIHVEISGFSFETENNQSIRTDWSASYPEALTLDIYDNCFEHVNSRNPGTDFALYVDGANQVGRSSEGALRLYNNQFDVTGGLLFENCRAVDVLDNAFNVTYEAVTFNYYGNSATCGDQLVNGNVFHHVPVDWAFAMNNWHGAGTYTVLPSEISNNVFTPSGFSYAILYGVAAAQSANHNILISENSIESGSLTVWGDFSNQAEFEATCNWWGTINPAVISGRISGNTTYIPWLIDGTDESPDPGFQPQEPCDQTPPDITCPADIIVQVHESSNPSATGFATAIDDGGGPVYITFADTWAAGTYPGTGVISRTWKATDQAGNDSTCVQLVNLIDTYTPQVVCPADIDTIADDGMCSALLDYEMPVVYDPGYSEGWEDTDYSIGDYMGWVKYNSFINSVLSGTDGITSKTGNRHGLITPPVSGFTGLFNRLGGYTSDFCNGYRVSIDIYMNLDDSAVVNDTYGWDLSVASSNQDGNHLRDFIFHTASNASGDILVGASNNSNYARRNDLHTLNHHVIDESGWYTFEWIFRDNGSDALAVDLSLLDENGDWLWTETRTTPADVISTIVGGNRYMWFTFIATDKLAVDNAMIERKTNVVTDFASGSAFPVGTTTVTLVSTDCADNNTNCSFDMTVEDTQKPVIACVADQTRNTDFGVCSYTAVGTEFDLVSAWDNCEILSIVNDYNSDSTLAGAVFPLGTTTVVWTVTDIHDNVESCSFEIEIVDNVPPVISIIGNNPFTICRYETYTDEGATALDICDGDITGLIQITSSVNTAIPGSYTVVYDVTDASGNSAQAIRTVNVISCGYALSGNFKYHNNAQTPLANVHVELQQNGVTLYDTITDANGNYSIHYVAYGTYDVVADCTLPTGGAINSLDAGQVNAWGVGPQYMIEKVRFLSADVLRNNYIDAGDAGRINTYFIYQGNPSWSGSVGLWSFWKANDPIFMNSFTEGLYPTVTVIPGTSNIVQNFYGMVTGDFNRSFVPGGAKSNGSVQLLEGNTIAVAPDEVVMLPVSAGFDMTVGAISLILNYPKDLIEIEDIFLADDPSQTIPFHASNNQLRMGWFNNVPVYGYTDQALFIMKVRVKSSVVNGQVIGFTLATDPLNELGDNQMEVIQNATLIAGKLKVTATGIDESVTDHKLSILPYPNPATETVNINYVLPVEGRTTIKIYDQLGRLVLNQHEGLMAAARHTYQLNVSAWSTGIYTVSIVLESESGVMTGVSKIVVHR
jgi:hypothetical protein